MRWVFSLVLACGNRPNMLRVGIIGISGYTGLTLLELLIKHPQVRLTYVGANNTQGKVSDIWPRLKGLCDLCCEKYNSQKAIESCDLIFLAVPHGAAMDIVPALLKANKKVIDLSADYRLLEAEEYQRWYHHEHKDKKNLERAVYGLPELYREDIKNASFIANPGCYPTAALLGLSPIVTALEDINSIIIDAKSGVSGAGRKADLGYIFPEVNENFKAYKVLHHQHTPEIEQCLSRLAHKDLSVHFVPHLLPINRGILETIYVSLPKSFSRVQIQKIYKNFYKIEPFVRMSDPGIQPEIKNVTGTNYCDIGIEISADGKLLVVTSVIDNLMKGASSQAVQNMNIMCGFKEEEGLI